jgi:hypothetical protein
MVPFDANLRDALEGLYAAFAPYPAPTTLEGSPYKDTVGMLRSLQAAPLRMLSDDQIGPYAGSALLTVGGVPDYKHYLPRIIELGMRGSGHMGADAPIIAERLKRAAWRTWPEAEQVSVRSAFRAAWSWSVEQHPDFGATAEDWLCGIAALGEPIERLLREWSARTSTQALLQSAWLAMPAARLMSSSDNDLAYWSYVSPATRKVVSDWVTGDERLAAFLHGLETVPEHDRWCIDRALETAGFRQRH